MTVLESGFHFMDSGIQLQDPLSVELETDSNITVSFIPD